MHFMFDILSLLCHEPYLGFNNHPSLSGLDIIPPFPFQMENNTDRFYSRPRGYITTQIRYIIGFVSLQRSTCFRIKKDLYLWVEKSNGRNRLHTECCIKRGRRVSEQWFERKNIYQRLGMGKIPFINDIIAT